MAQYPRLSVQGLSLTRSEPSDVPTIESMTSAAYTKYVERIGRPPAPMMTDWNQLLTTHHVFTLRNANHEILGAIVLKTDHESDSMKVNNLVVDPAAQGHGYGRVLMDYAENAARALGCTSLRLFTNVKMHENLGFYAKCGFQEIERKVEDGYERVYFHKDL